MKILSTTLLFFGLACISSCQSNDADPIKSVQPEFATAAEIQKSWTGGAEISSYTLKQNRYGTLREGESILIYVKEPFLKDRQVKDESGRGNLQVLKLNATRNFRTGLYPYSVMTSVFHPLGEQTDSKALKVTTSIQDWCGHVFMQTNRRNGSMKTEIKSYFEQEEGGEFTENAEIFLEDEVWTAIRVDPAKLPTGKLTMIPSNLHQRFTHSKPASLAAEAKWLKGDNDKTITYQISYPDSGRKLAIEIQTSSPYAIESWKESDANGVLSSGELKKRLTNIDYWNYSSEQKGAKLRKQLNLN